jgi:predicted RNA-binding protein with EMAP domain
MTIEVFLQVQEAGLKASVEVFKERAQKLRESLGGELPGDWKDKLSKDINNVKFMRSLNEHVNKSQQAKLQEHGFSVIKEID